MNDSDHDILDRMLTEHGTGGLAEMLAALCDARAETDPEPGMAAWWKAEAAAFRRLT